MPVMRIAVPSSRFGFHIRARSLGSYYVNPAPPKKTGALGSVYYPRTGFALPSPGFAGLGADYAEAVNPFTGAITPGSYQWGDLDASGNVTTQVASGQRVSIGTLTPGGALSQTSQQQANQAAAQDEAMRALNTAFYGQPTAPAYAGPAMSPGAPRGVVSSSWLDSTTLIGGMNVPNALLAAGAAVAVIAMVNRKKR